MQGSKNPLIIRNYRVVYPACYKDINLKAPIDGIPFGPGPTFTTDFQLQFKIEAAPIILTYESEFIMRLKFRLPGDKNDPYANLEVPDPENPYMPSLNNGIPIFNTSAKAALWQRILSGLHQGIATNGPLVRFKYKSMASAIKRAWCTMSNMTFQSVRTPEYLNEILLRKPVEQQRKFPDNYTGEYLLYSNVGTLDGLNLSQTTLNAIPDSHQYNATGGVGVDSATASVMGARDTLSTDGFHGQLLAGLNGRSAMLYTSLGPRGNTWSQWDNVSFSTPSVSLDELYVEMDIRIPLTELLPVFKIGVVPCMMINSSLIDLVLDIYHPDTWVRSRFLGTPISMETWLNISTVSFPDINPMAEMILRPKIMGDRFIAPFLDYFTVEKIVDVRSSTRVDFHFNVIQFFRNVPFISLSFLDVSTPAIGEGEYESPADTLIMYNGTNVVTLDPAKDKAGENVKYTTAGNYTDLPIPLGPVDRERGGFYSIPPACRVNDLRIMLGESAFPLTQYPMSFNDMYMYNRKHFEMYGRDYNVTRVCPISRHRHGDASYFFDLSHGPFSGFSIDSDSPLQIVGTIQTGNTIIQDKQALGNGNSVFRIKILLTIWYSNNFNAMLNSGGVVPLQ